MKVSKAKAKGFLDYCDEYYNPKDPMFSGINVWTRALAGKAFTAFSKGYRVPFDGDSIDRENFRDFFVYWYHHTVKLNKPITFTEFHEFFVELNQNYGAGVGIDDPEVNYKDGTPENAYFG